MNDHVFNDETYHDDRMFVLYLCKCTVMINDDVEATTIYHEVAPDNHQWSVVTYRNVERYRATRVDCFFSEAEAIAYMQSVEPVTPLISLGGRSPPNPLPYGQFVRWKEQNSFKEYDYKKMYPPGVSNPQETLYRQIQTDTRSKGMSERDRNMILKFGAFRREAKPGIAPDGIYAGFFSRYDSASEDIRDLVRIRIEGIICQNQCRKFLFDFSYLDHPYIGVVEFVEKDYPEGEFRIYKGNFQRKDSLRDFCEIPAWCDLIEVAGEYILHGNWTENERTYAWLVELIQTSHRRLTLPISTSVERIDYER